MCVLHARAIGVCAKCGSGVIPGLACGSFLKFCNSIFVD